MSESAFSGFEITDDDTEAEATDFISPSDVKPRTCPFTILFDSLEQKPYTFSSIIGDAKDDYSPITVKTVKKRLSVADYAIKDVPGIAIERKSKEDLFGSVANGTKRDNFLERLRKMQTQLKFGAVVIECYQEEIYLDPPTHSSLNPKTVFRTSLSWAIQFPLIHWYWCKDRDAAEQTTFRLLEKYHEHETSSKYKHHNKPLDNSIEAFELGIKSRMTSRECQVGYSKDNPLLLDWKRGWTFWSNLGCDGDLGSYYNIGELPPSEVAEAVVSYKAAKKGKNTDKIKPLRNQTSFLDAPPVIDDDAGLEESVDGIINSLKKAQNESINSL